jgi:hypothetical protein
MAGSITSGNFSESAPSVGDANPAFGALTDFASAGPPPRVLTTVSTRPVASSEHAPANAATNASSAHRFTPTIVSAHVHLRETRSGDLRVAVNLVESELCNR